MIPGDIPTITYDHQAYTITTDKEKMVLADIHQWLSEHAYWSLGIPFETVKTTFENSYCIGILYSGKQIGFARLATDYGTFGYLADVYITEEHRGRGLSKLMLQTIFNQEWVKGLRRIMLSTIHAHDLYRPFGFTACRYPDRLMEVLLPATMYQKP